MVAVAKQPKKQISIRIRGENHDRLKLAGDKLMMNVSEMMDRAIEFYLAHGFKADLAEIRRRREAIEAGFELEG